MKTARLESHFDPREFSYDTIIKAWQTKTGLNSVGRYFFTAHLIHQPFGGGGNYMAFLRRPNKTDWKYDDVPFESDKGFLEEGDSEAAVFKRVYYLGWRIEEIDSNYLPVEVNSDIQALIELSKK